MPTAAFTTLGCKVNQYETQRILDDFEARGFVITEFTAPADIYVINTCSVTQAAERKSRSMVRRLARQNPEARVVMTGCYGEMARIKGEEVSEASLIVPNHQKMETLAHVLRAFPDLERAVEQDPKPRPEVEFSPRSRATLKVQDGCNVFCSFCSIPYTRHVMRSRPVSELLAEAASLARQGYREIVVTGVLVGAYGQETPGEPDLAELLLELVDVPGIERVRLSSIEPTQVTDKLLDAFAREPRLCRHLHIPLQSGDSGVLKVMNRPYDQEFYLDRCRTAYARIPDLAITADIMVGFPGEDEAAFQSTLHMVEQVGFARAHVFRYSPRPNTPAALLRNQVADSDKDERSKRLAEACREAQQRFIRRYIGRTVEVLVEGKGGHARDSSGESGNDGNVEVTGSAGSPDRLLSGYSSNYIRVQLTGGSHLIGTLCQVRLLEPTSDGALGECGYFSALEPPPDAEFIPLATFAAQAV